MAARAALDAAYRAEAGRIRAGLIRALRDFERAEDALAEACARALQRWPTDGVPDNPAAWLTTVARRRALDALRTEKRARARHEAQRALESLLRPEADAPPAAGAALALASAEPGVATWPFSSPGSRARCSPPRRRAIGALCTACARMSGERS
jgi:predicted RNA polymerase sigma factor